MKCNRGNANVCSPFQSYPEPVKHLANELHFRRVSSNDVELGNTHSCHHQNWKHICKNQCKGYVKQFDVKRVPLDPSIYMTQCSVNVNEAAFSYNMSADENGRVRQNIIWKNIL